MKTVGVQRLLYRGGSRGGYKFLTNRGKAGGGAHGRVYNTQTNGESRGRGIDQTNQWGLEDEGTSKGDFQAGSWHMEGLTAWQGEGQRTFHKKGQVFGYDKQLGRRAQLRLNQQHTIKEKTHYNISPNP